MQVKGDLIIIFCQRDANLRFYALEDLRLIATQSLLYDGYWSKISDKGFEIVANGNAYKVFFTAY